MAFWLVKSEPDAYSWQTFVRDGRSAWTGIRNAQARINLNTMRLGDGVLFYHSQVGKEVVGTATVVREAYPDPTSEDPRWLAVDLAPGAPLPRPVTLTDIKADPELAEMTLIRHTRLSVSPVTDTQYRRVLQRGGSTESG